MRHIIFLLAISILLLRSAVAAESTNTFLSFYVVSEAPVSKGKYIDTPAIPKVGYIGPTANLVITNLLSVDLRQSPSRSIMLDARGNETVLTNDAQPTLTVRLLPEDAKKFADVTQQALNKRLLVIFADRPLTARQKSQFAD